MEKKIMIKYIVNEKERMVTAKFYDNKFRNTNENPWVITEKIWVEYVVDDIFNSVAECKECSDVFLTDKIVYPHVKEVVRAKRSYCGIAKCSNLDIFDAKKGKYLAKKRLLKNYYETLHKAMLSLIYDMSIPTPIPFKVCENSIKKANDIASDIRLFKKDGIMLNDYISEAQREEAWSKDNMNNNNCAPKQDKENKQLVFDNIKIEVKNFVVSTTVSDGRNAYVYRVKCKDYSSESLHKVIMESIHFAKNIMKHRFPMYNELYYTVDFASNDLVSAGKWRACTKEIILRDNGLIFKTKEEAVAVAKKMLAVVQKRKD